MKIKEETGFGCEEYVDGTDREHRPGTREWAVQSLSIALKGAGLFDLEGWL